MFVETNQVGEEQFLFHIGIMNNPNTPFWIPEGFSPMKIHLVQVLRDIFSVKDFGKIQEDLLSATMETTGSAIQRFFLLFEKPFTVH